MHLIQVEREHHTNSSIRSKKKKKNRKKKKCYNKLITGNTKKLKIKHMKNIIELKCTDSSGRT